MKAKMFLIIVMFVPMFLFGQTTEPEFTGVKKAASSNDPLIDYLTNNFICPNGSKCIPEGTAVVQFVVTPEGKLTDIEVINSVCCLIDNELIRALKTTDGMWKPGQANGTPEAMKKEVSLMFVANRQTDVPKEYFTKNAIAYFNKGNKLFLESGNPKKALKFYDKSINYRPNEASTLLLRGMCHYHVGDKEGARNDWERIKTLGNIDVDRYLEKLSDLDGFEEMQVVLNE